MSADVAARPSGASTSDDQLVVSRRQHRRRGLLLLAVAVWSVWVWGTRVLNLVRADEDYSVSFIVVHAVLYGSAFLIAGGLAVMGTRMVRQSRD